MESSGSAGGVQEDPGSILAKIRDIEPYVRENSPFQYDELLLRTLKKRDDLIQNPITIEVLHDLHKIVFQSQERSDFRKHNVQVGDNPCMDHELVPGAINALVKKIGEALEKAETKESFTKKAMIFHLDFLNVHPYSDVNGRSSRLLLSLLFFKSLPTIVIPDRYWLHLLAIYSRLFLELYKSAFN
ncbi:hypothetical protein niasHT_031349 [Heterodera trifolii]|uniref:Fido domain-containing protein n=1 Tax=Heterodera trifolii TaxID=157864 RepID=A0ABD2J692_9BILA